MKKLMLLVAAAFVASLVLGQVALVKAAEKTHDMTTQVVSVDLEKKTITFKNDKSENQTAPVIGKAVESLKTLKAGDKVTLTCSDNEKGEHQGVSAIKLAKTGY